MVKTNSKSSKTKKHKATIIDDKLLLDCKLYGNEHLHQLPEYLRPENVTTLSNLGTVVFFSGFSPFILLATTTLVTSNYLINNTLLLSKH